LIAYIGEIKLSLRLGYLTQRQRMIGRLKSEGFTEAGIGWKLDITRQTVHKALNVANQKILQALGETAKINKIEIRTVFPSQGYLIGYSLHFSTGAFVTYSPKDGIQICYPDVGNCKKCNRANKCRETLLNEAKNRKIELEEDISQISTSKSLKPYSQL